MSASYLDFTVYDDDDVDNDDDEDDVNDSYMMTRIF